jgi:hypothetical protein
MMTTAFVRYSKDRTTEIKVTNPTVTWRDLSENFFEFLQGCGYQLTRCDFAEYWAQYLDECGDNSDKQRDNNRCNSTIWRMSSTGCDCMFYDQKTD